MLSASRTYAVLAKMRVTTSPEDAGFATAASPELAVRSSKLHAPQYLLPFRCVGDTGVARTTLGPTAQAIDLLVHGLCQRHRLGQGRAHMLGGGVPAGVEGVVKGAVNCLLGLRAAELLAGISKQCQVETCGIAASLSPV